MVTGSGGLRLTVIGDPDLVLEVPQEPAGSSASETVPDIYPLRSTPQERAAGQARYEVTVEGWVLQVLVESSERAALRDRARRVASGARSHASEVLRARIPGRVVRLWVETGQRVVADERLLAIEAMKMENEVRAPRAGTVASVAVSPGQPVELGAQLLTLD